MAFSDRLASAPDFVGPPEPTPTNTWIARATQEVIGIITSGTDLGHKLSQWWIDHRVQIEAYLLHAGLTGAKDLITLVADVITSGAPLAAALSAHTINQISGTNINEDQVFADFLANPGRAPLTDIGAQFHQVIDKMFPLGESTTNNKDRADRQFAVDNLNAYFGTNLSFQLRSLAIGTIASMVPGHALRHLEGLHQSINWAYGFGWLSWSVLSAVMGVTTTKPLTEYYNAQIKGNDFSESEALHAFVEKRIDNVTLNKVLDNLGMRDDIRGVRIEQTRVGLTAEQATKAFIEGYLDQAGFDKAMDEHRIRDEVRPTRVALALPNLTEGDVQDLYNNGLYSEQDVSQHYRQLGYQAVTQQAKIDLIKDQRLFQLQKQLATAYHHAYVLGTATQAEYSQYLSSIHYSQLEIDVELKRAEVEGRVHTQKRLTRAEVVRLVTHGGMDPQEGLQRLIDMGLPDHDARRLLADAILEHAISVIPSKVKTACLTPQFEQNILTTAITVATSLDPTYVLDNKDFMSYVQCIVQEYINTTGTGGGGGGGTTPPGLPPLPATPAQHPGLPTPDDAAFACLLWRYIRAAQPIPTTAAAWMIQNAGASAMVIAQNDPACQ